MSKISIIVSVSENWVIGKDNKLLWKLSSDLQRFKKLTTGHAIIMGQKTMESLPKKFLPNRTNIVLTDDSKLSAENIIPAFSIADALNKAQYYDDTEIFIIGGGSIYKQFLPIADKLYLTVVHVEIDGDTTFPKIDESEWKLEFSDFKEKDDKNEFPHTYKIYTNDK